MQKLNGFRVAALLGEGVERNELLGSMEALRASGATVELVSLRAGEVAAFENFERKGGFLAQRRVDEVQPGEFQALLLPGGLRSVDLLRSAIRVQLFIRAMNDFGRPIAALSHAPWLLVSAGVMPDRLLTGAPSLQDDVRNAGGSWLDKPVVVDRNWVTAQKADDEFFTRMVALFSRTAAAAYVSAATEGSQASPVARSA